MVFNALENRLLVHLEITRIGNSVVQKRERLGGLLNYYYGEAGRFELLDEVSQRFPEGRELFQHIVELADACLGADYRDAESRWTAIEQLVRLGDLILETAQVCQFAQREDTLDTLVFDDPGRVICNALVATRNSYGRV